MKIVHISATTRAKGDNGGVPKFGDYLQKAIGCDVVAAGEVDIRKYDIVIGDGYFVSGADLSSQRVISIVHGSWKEFAIRNKKQSDFFGEAERQGNIWKNSRVEKVAVSQSSAKYLEIHHGVKADKVILNAVDTNLFVPKTDSLGYWDKPLVIYAANDYNKDGQGRLGQIVELCKDEFNFRYLGAAQGEEHTKFAEGDIYIQASFYEGNSYATLEAMSCGLPVVASRTGLFEDTVFKPMVGLVCDWDATAESFAAALQSVKKFRFDLKPREWVLENANFDKFAAEWQQYINK